MVFPSAGSELRARYGPGTSRSRSPLTTARSTSERSRPPSSPRRPGPVRATARPGRPRPVRPRSARPCAAARPGLARRPDPRTWAARSRTRLRPVRRIRRRVVRCDRPQRPGHLHPPDGTGAVRPTTAPRGRVGEAHHRCAGSPP
jgi:hypothetical protein